MKLSVRIRGDWFAVPCKGSEKVSWLGDESLRRYYKSKCTAGHATETVYEVRKAKGGAILDPDDAIKDVLDEADFVTVGTSKIILLVFFFNLNHFIDTQVTKWIGQQLRLHVYKCSPFY